MATTAEKLLEAKTAFIAMMEGFKAKYPTIGPVVAIADAFIEAAGNVTADVAARLPAEVYEPVKKLLSTGKGPTRRNRIGLA